MTSSGGSSPLPTGRISRIDIVHKMNWYKWDEKCVGIGSAKVVFPVNYRGYAKTLSRDDADATYEKIMNAKLPERVKIGDDGLFVQTAGKFSFEIDKDEWAEEFLLFQKGQERKGYAQTIEFPEWAELLDAKHPLRKTKLCDDIPTKEYRYFDTNSAMCGPSAWSAQNVGSFAPAYLSPDQNTVIDYFYEDTDIDVSDYLCSVIDDSGNCVFSGFINSDGVEYTPENDIIKISCTSLLVTLSQASQKNSMIYYTPTSGGTEKLETNIKNIMIDVFRNVNRMFIGRDPGWVDSDEQFTQVRTMNGLLHPTFSGDFSEDIVTRQCTDESFDIDAENFSSRPTNEQLANKGICVPQWPQDSGNYDIDQQKISFEVFANKGSGGLLGITFVTHLEYRGRKNPGDYDEIKRRKDMVSISHFRYRRGILENSVFEIDNVTYMPGRPGIGVGIGAITGTGWLGSIVSYASLYDYISNVDNILLGLDKSTKIQIFPKMVWENDNNTNIADPACGFMGAEFTVVEVGTPETPKCYYKINVQKKKYVEYVVGMPVTGNKSEYYEMRPHVNIFDINITFTGNDYVEQYMFNTAGSKPRVMRIGEMLKVMLYMANIRIEQDVEKAVISKRDIKITDSTEIIKISDSDLIDPNIGQNKIELPTVDLAIVLESDVGAGGDENGVDGINSYSRMLNEKYSSLSIETKNKIAAKVSTLFNIYNLQPGGLLNILNRLYITNSILDDFSIHEIKTMSVNATPVINITSFELSGDIAKFEWTSNNIASSFDVTVVISRTATGAGTGEDIPNDNYLVLERIKNTGRFVCNIKGYSGHLFFTVAIPELNYMKSYKFKDVSDPTLIAYDGNFISAIEIPLQYSGNVDIVFKVVNSTQEYQILNNVPYAVGTGITMPGGFASYTPVQGQFGEIPLFGYFASFKHGTTEEVSRNYAFMLGINTGMWVSGLTVSQFETFKVFAFDVNSKNYIGAVEFRIIDSSGNVEYKYGGTYEIIATTGVNGIIHVSQMNTPELTQGNKKLICSFMYGTIYELSCTIAEFVH